MQNNNNTSNQKNNCTEMYKGKNPPRPLIHIVKDKAADILVRVLPRPSLSKPADTVFNDIRLFLVLRPAVSLRDV